MALSRYRHTVWVQGEMRSSEWRLLHVFDVSEGTYRCWRLHLHPEADAEHQRLGRRRVQRVHVWRAAAGHGPPTHAVLHFDNGACLTYALGTRSAEPKMSRRRRRALLDFERRRQERLELQLDTRWAAYIRPDEPRWDGMGRITALAALPAEHHHKLLAAYSDATVAVTDFVESGSSTATGHQGDILDLTYVPGHAQGDLVVTMGLDGTVRLTSLTEGAPVRTLLEHTPPPRALAVRRVGRQWVVAVATSDGLLHRVDLDSGRPLGLPLRIGSGGRVRLSTFRLGSTECVGVQGAGRGLQLYDLVTGDRVGGQEGLHEASAVCAVDGTTAIGGDDGVIRLWPGVHAADSTRINAHEAPVLAVGAVCARGTRSALVSVGRDHLIRCWDVVEQRELWRRRLPHTEPWTDSLVVCATVGRTREGHALVVTGEIGGRVTVLTLIGGVPLAEREFTVPGIVTAVTTGTVSGRDVVVAATDSGRVACWDVTHGRWYGLGPEPEHPAWTTALALDPAGSGRLFAGADDGTVREWALPACRPLGEPLLLHEAPVHALAFAQSARGTRVFSAGGDRRLVAVRGETWERRLPLPLRSLVRADGGGLLGGDERGTLWRLDERAGGWELTEALDAVPSATAVSAFTAGGRTAVAVGGSDGTVQVRDGTTGALRHQLRPACESAVVELMAVSGAAPGGTPRPVLFTRSELGVLERWDLGGPEGERPGRTVLREVVLSDGGALSGLVRLAGRGPRDSDVALALDFRSDFGRLPVRVHSVGAGRAVSNDWPSVGRSPYPLSGGAAAVRCGGRWLIGVPMPKGLSLVDAETGHRALVPGQHAVLALGAAPDDPGELILVGRSGTSVLPAAPVLAGLAEGPGPGPRLDVRPTHEHPAALLGVRYAAVLPGGAAYAVAAWRHLVVVGARDGALRTGLELPSVCTGLAAGPGGELAVATRNGAILLDVPDTRP